MLAVSVLALAGFAVYAAVREWRLTTSAEIAAPTTAVAERPALTADEERYAHDLWSIHQQVRTVVPRLSFAGLAYKMGDIGKGDIPARIAPVGAMLAAARTSMQSLVPPASLREPHREYLEAIDTYQQAFTEMGGIARDGNEEHLIRAQALSERASGALLKVSEVLWPGEHKPN